MADHPSQTGLALMTAVGTVYRLIVHVTKRGMSMKAADECRAPWLARNDIQARVLPSIIVIISIAYIIRFYVL
jgi:hypothetical protein